METTAAKPIAEQIEMMSPPFVIDLSNCLKAAMGSSAMTAIRKPAVRRTSLVSMRFTSAQMAANVMAMAAQIEIDISNAPPGI